MFATERFLTFGAIAAFVLFAGCSSVEPSAFAEGSGPEPLPPINDVELGVRGEFLVNGEPFLPIMSWLQHPTRWISFEELRGLHFNTFMGNQVSALEQARAAGDAGGYAVVRLGDPEEIAEAAGHDYLLGWHHPDEPDMPRASEDGGFEPKIPPEEIADNYRFVKDEGIERPVFVTFTANFMEEFRGRYSAGQQAEMYPAFVASADVVGYDHYPIYGHGRPAWLNRQASGVAQLVELAEGRPVYSWIETSRGSRWMTYERQPDVLPEHTRYQVWSALIKGATAIGYFTHAWEPEFTEFAPTEEMQEELKRLNEQITRLAPAILAPPTDREIAMAIPTTMEPDMGSRFLATEYEGDLYIFAQNTDLGPEAEQAGQFDPISPREGVARIRVEGLEAGTEIEVVDEDRTITAGDGEFRDGFDPLGERIYRISID